MFKTVRVFHIILAIIFISILIAVLFFSLKVQPKKIAILGDSILVGMAKSCNALALKNKYDFQFYDFAKSSDSSDDLLDRCLDLSKSHITRSSSKKYRLSDYDIIFVLIGFNDTDWIRTLDNIRKLYMSAKNKGVDNVVYISLYSHKGYKYYTKLGGYKKYCQDTIIKKTLYWRTSPYCDSIIWLRDSVHLKKYLSDGMHLNSFGQRVLRNEIVARTKEQYPQEN